MEIKKVQALISQGEGQCCEFKTSFAEQDEAIKSLCAFSHAQGGIVLFGITNSRQINGVTLGKNTIENFVKKIKENTQPLLVVSIDKVSYGGKTIVAVTATKVSQSHLFYAFNTPYIRIGETNQVMPPDEVKRRLFIGFRAENVTEGKINKHVSRSNESWKERENRRIRIYQNNGGLFLVHTWRPSSRPNQVADIIINLWQHKEGPLTKGTIKSVEYHLGSMFFDHTVVKTNRSSNFRLKVSAYSPMLCLARVCFDDGTPPLDLERYIDF